MQPQPCEVHAENDEYKREEQRPAKQRKQSWETAISLCSHSHPQTQRTLWHPSHFIHFMDNRPKSTGTPTYSSNAHNHVVSKVNKMCMRLTLQHIPVTMQLLDFCHQIQHSTSDYIHRRNMEIVGGMQATEHNIYMHSSSIVSCSYPTLSQREMV